MKILLTGATGFIGSCFLGKLNRMGIDDAVIVDTAAAPGDNPNLRSKKFKDYISRDALLTALDGPALNDREVVVHLGACADTTESDRAYLTRNNLQYSQALARWALGKGNRFHYASSASVYGDGAQGYS